MLVSRLLSPILNLRILYMKTHRIGHQVADIDLYLRRRQLKMQPKSLDLFITEKPANEALVTIVKRHVPLIESSVLAESYFLLRKWFPNSTRIMRIPAFSLLYKEFNEAPAQLKLSEKEEQDGQNLLRSMGVPEGAPFVCFHNRDKTYLEQMSIAPGVDASYHDYRNSSIENYLPAAEALASAGIWAIRLGKVVDRPLQGQSARVIDYALKHRSDLGDIYLQKHCKFFLGTTSGLINVAWSFDVPTAVVNSAPFGQAPLHPYDIFIPKKYRDSKTERILKFREIMDRKIDRLWESKQFTDEGVDLVENSADEILQVALEMNARLDKTWVPNPEDEELQKRFWSLFPKGHIMYGNPCRIGAQFLRDNRHLLD